MKKCKRPASYTAAFLGLILLALMSSASAQPPLFDASRFVAGIKYVGLSYHPGGGENEEHYKRSLDSKDYWVLLVGSQVDVDYIVHPYFFLRASTAFYKDCADVWAGYYHFGFRANLPIGERWSFRIGIGPTYLWRQNWLYHVKGYTRDSFFGPATHGDYQGAFIIYGGDVEAEYRPWDRVSLVYAVIPGYPEVIQNSLGMRFGF